MSSKKIWKYSLENISSMGQAGETEVLMPVNAEVVFAGMDKVTGMPCVWAIVDSDMPQISRTFQIYGTGHPIDNPNWTYVGTYQVGPFVWHVGWLPVHRHSKRSS